MFMNGTFATLVALAAMLSGLACGSSASNPEDTVQGYWLLAGRILSRNE